METCLNIVKYVFFPLCYLNWFILKVIISKFLFLLFNSLYNIKDMYVHCWIGRDLVKGLNILLSQNLIPLTS